MRVPTSTAGQFFVVAGNLILTTQRLIFEPYRNQRAAFGQHGSKQTINLLAKLSDRIAPRVPIAVSLDDLDFFFGRTTVGRGDAARRDAVLARTLEQKSRSRSSST